MALTNGKNMGSASSDTDDPDPSGLAGKDRPLTVRGNDRRRGGDARHDESAVSSRRDAPTREDATHLREREVRTAETKQTASQDYMTVLQQANANLVIATIEAQKLAEQVQASKAQLDHLAHHDVLTDLPNRILMHDRIGQAIELARRQDRQLAVMFLDVDRFKNINDSLGHMVGDQLLMSVAQRLVECVRHSDTVSRQGGDEFIILLADVEHAEDAALSARKMLTALAQPHHIDRHDIHVDASIGISIYPHDGQDADSLVKSADTAMYHAKENGGNNYKFFEQDMNARAVQRLTIETDLRLALGRQEFLLNYQPIIDLQSGAIVSVEALTRWRHPHRGLILPEHFIWIAEDSGLIVPIGAWILREACKQARAWQDAGLPPIPVAVNISAVQFRHKDFLENLTGILKDSGLAPRYLELELTESVLMHDADAAVSVLKALKAIGVRLTLDDFGTGYSGLSYLKRSPVDTLKIDKSFMHGITQATDDSDDAAIVAAVIGLGKSLNQRVIAEGVETREQLAFLQARGCSEGQGFYFSRPVAAQEVAELLRTGIEGVVGAPKAPTR